jgi:hypothetical protein
MSFLKPLSHYEKSVDGIGQLFDDLRRSANAKKNDVGEVPTHSNDTPSWSTEAVSKVKALLASVRKAKSSTKTTSSSEEKTTSSSEEKTTTEIPVHPVVIKYRSSVIRAFLYSNKDTVFKRPILVRADAMFKYTYNEFAVYHNKEFAIQRISAILHGAIITDKFLKALDRRYAGDSGVYLSK